MSKKNKNGVDSPKKTSPSKKPTKKDLELIISSLEDKQLRLKAEFDNFRKRKESEISSLLSCSFKTAQRCTGILLDQNEIGRRKRSSNGGRPYYLYFDLLLGHLERWSL